MHEAVDLAATSFWLKKSRGLKAYHQLRPYTLAAPIDKRDMRRTATWIVLECPTKDISDVHPSRSITAATKTGPFLALEAAMKAPSGDQLVSQLFVRLPGAE